jgi:hypothetical protein
VSAKTKMDGFCKKFEHTKLLHHSLMNVGTILVGAWFIYNGDTCHMTREWELFERSTESDSYVYVELGMGT